MPIVSDFVVMYKDTPAAKIHIKNGNADIIKLIPDSYKQPFSGERSDMFRVYEFLKSRCYEDGRSDLKEILDSAGIKTNNPWVWVKITHGAVWNDFFWIRFPDEKINWEDVRLR